MVHSIQTDKGNEKVNDIKENSTHMLGGSGAINQSDTNAPLVAILSD